MSDLEKYPFNENDVRRFYRWLGHNPTELTEIRVIEWVSDGKGAADSFFVNTEDAFVRVCREWNGKRHVYAGVNPRKTKGGSAEHVARITAVPFDIDGPIPDKRRHAATESEIQVAKERMFSLVEWLKNKGYGNPYVDFSGNGYRVALRVDIPVYGHEKIGAQLNAFFEEAKAEFPFLENISDLPRIIKVPGTWSLKGNNTPERPHRQAYIISLGDTTPNEKLKEHILNLKNGKEPTDATNATNATFTSSCANLKLNERKVQKLRPCFRRFLEVGGRFTPKGDRSSETRMRQQLVQEMVSAGFSKADILSACTLFDDYDAEKSRTEVERVFNQIEKDGITHWTCKSIHKHGGCLGAECRLYAKNIGLTEDEQTKRKKRDSQADLLVEYCLAQNPTVFHDQHGTPYARIKQNNVNVIMPVRSRQFKSWLAGLMWQKRKKAPGNEALMSARNVIESMALHDGNECNLYNRVAPGENGSIWVDMCDDKWRAINITADGWTIVNDPPILFRRYSHQKPLPEPIRGGNIWKIFEFTNLEKNDEESQLVLLVTIVSYLIPEIPHVVLVFYGIQGSGKTLIFKLIRRLIDPSSVETLAMPRDENERVQQLVHHWCAFYDNITNIPIWVSDTLCRAATGGGFTKRELYTDDEDVIYDFMRCVGLNGINIAAQRGDLLDRSLLIGLKSIPADRRREEKEILAAFERCRAEILGGVLDALSQAIKLYPVTNPPKLFRMADFTKWGCAIAKALGKTEKDFIDAYDKKVKEQIEEAAHSSPVATVLLDFMESRKEWEGTPSALYRELLACAKTNGISTRTKAWPKAPHILIRQLNELIPALAALDLEVETGIHTGTQRRVIINNKKSVSSVKSVKPQNGTNATNGISPIYSKAFELNEVVGCTQLGDPRVGLASVGKCDYCGKKPEHLTHSVKTFSAHHLVCEDCAAKINAHLKKRREEEAGV